MNPNLSAQVFLVTWAILTICSAQSISGLDECLPAGKYTLCQNLWAADAGVGSQASTFVAAVGGSVSWSTEYTWSNNSNQVKSFANVISDLYKGMQFSEIESVPTFWSWAYASKSRDTKANVAYDIWTGIPSSGDPASNASSYELMVWLSGKESTQPLGTIVAANISLAGYKWDLWEGSHKNWKVLSFVYGSDEIETFSADLNEFFTYLTTARNFSSSQYIQGIQAGTEPFVGTAKFVTSNYTVKVNKRIIKPVQSNSAQKPMWGWR